MVGYMKCGLYVYDVLVLNRIYTCKMYVYAKCDSHT